MADGEVSIPNTDGEAPCQLPPLEIPKSFTDHFLWSHNSDACPLSEIPSAHKFSDEMVQEIQAAAACAFEHAIRKKKEDSIVQSVTLFCPHEGGLPFVDSMVKLVASQQNADVLVLDALELAAIQFGAIGEGGGIFASLYNMAKKSRETSDDDKSQRYIDALVNTPAKKISTSSEDVSIPTRRIIYFKDYGKIARIARLLLGFILRAIQKLNRTVDTILVFGFASGIKLLSGMDDERDSDDLDDDDSNSELRTKWHDALLAGGQTLGRILPQFSNSYPSPTQKEPSCSRMCPLSAQFFLPQVYASSDLNHYQLSRYSIFDGVDPICRDFIFAVISRDAHTEESRILRRSAIKDRTRSINEALLRLTIGERGGLMDGNLPDVAFESNDKSSDHFHSSILTPPVADLIAATAIGLVKADSPEPSESEPSKFVRVPPAQIVKAYEINLTSLQVRKEWIEQEGKANLQEKPAQEDPQKNIADEVMKCSSLSKYEQRLLGCIVQPGMLTITFDDVCAEATVVETLRSMVSLPLLFPEQFGYGVLARQGLGGILLYGPPGTGKTTLCRALAYECGAQMLIVKPSDIFDKWAGESEKLAEAIFSLARRLSPCVIFIDEADTLFAERSNKSSWRDDIVTEFLQEMDGFSSASANREKRVLIIGATNRPFNLDPAILRRLPRRMMVGLPGRNERESILSIHLKGETLGDDVDLNELANITDEYSGSDLKDLCISAVMAAVKDAIGEPDWKSLRKHNHLNSEPKGDESDPPNAEKKIEVNEAQPNGGTRNVSESQTRIITKAHFEEALEKILPSFSEKAQAEMYRWHKANSPGARRSGRAKFVTRN